MSMMDSLFNNDFGGDMFFGGRGMGMNFFGDSDFGLGYQQNFRSTHQRHPGSGMSFTIINGGPPSMGGGFGMDSFAEFINAHMQGQPDDGRRPTS